MKFLAWNIKKRVKMGNKKSLHEKLKNQIEKAEGVICPHEILIKVVKTQRLKKCRYSHHQEPLSQSSRKIKPSFLKKFIEEQNQTNKKNESETFTVSFSKLKACNVSSKEEIIKDIEYFASSGRFKAIKSVEILKTDRVKFTELMKNSKIAAKERQETKERRLKKRKEKSKILFALADEILSKNENLEISRNHAKTTNSKYIEIYNIKTDEEIKLRFSDHKKGRNHYRFNQFTGERDYIDNSDTITINSKTQLLKEIEKISKVN